MEKNIRAAMAKYPGQKLYLYADSTVSPLFFPNKNLLYALTPSHQTATEVRLGWYLLKDDSFAPTATFETAKGIVAYFDVKGQPRSISIAQTIACYCPKKFWIGADSWDDGQANTEKILQVGKEKGTEMPATEWCVAQGGWHPAIEELKNAFAHGEIINTSLAAIGAEPLGGWYISSSESSGNPADNAWHWSFSNDNWDWYNKNNSTHVRCFYYLFNYSTIFSEDALKGILFFWRKTRDM